VQKLRRTVERDDEVTRSLESQGWQVVRLWESEIKNDVIPAADLVLHALKEQAHGAHK
jgi:G:T-mismatch repair DNA endonuclease (very short patch repair protein)